MSGRPELQGCEFVAHLFVAADGHRRDADYRYLRDLWHRCCDEFGVTDHIPGYDRNPSEDPLAPPRGPGGVLAARRSTGPGKHQAVLRRLHDVFCLAVLRSPAPGDGRGWPELDAEWATAVGQPPDGVIGSVRILQARLTDPAGVPDGALGSVVAAAAGVAGDWWRGGTVRGPVPFAAWEASDPPATPAASDPSDPPAAPAASDPSDPSATWEGRAHRRVVVLAPADRDAELSAWTWSRGDPELTPFARYLLHAAKVRYELRVWEAGQGFRALRGETDEAVGSLLRLVDDTAGTGRDPDRSELMTASARLVRVQARELGLVDRATRLREIRRTVAIASNNMTATAGQDQSGGLFADDKALVGWFDRQLDHDATYLEAALERARAVTVLGDQLIQRGLQRRQERFNLGLTGVVGAVLMVLAAIQSLDYKVPIPGAVQPAVVSALGAFALLVSLVVLRIAVPERRWTWLVACAATALFGATVAWVVVASQSVADDGVAARGVLWAWGGLGAAVGLVIAVTITASGRVRKRRR